MKRLILILTGLLLLTGCVAADGVPGLQLVPTAQPTALGVVVGQPANPESPGHLAPTPTFPPGDSGSVDASTAPDLTFADTDGDSAACPVNTRQIGLVTRAGEPFGAVSRVVSTDGLLYIVADGGLYRTSLGEIEAAGRTLTPESMIPPRTPVAGWVVQELTDAAYDATTGRVYVLDKVGHVFYYDPAGDRTSVAYRAQPDQDTYGGLEPELVAMDVDAAGRVILLDTAQGRLWTPAGFTALEVVGESQALTSGVDVAAVDDRFYVLRYDGTISVVRASTGSTIFQGTSGRQLALSLARAEHLNSAEALVAVDALRREVVVMSLPRGDGLTRHTFAFPAVGLLRDAAFAGGNLVAVADNDLYVYDSTGRDCDTLAGGFDRPTLYGVDVLTALGDATNPIEGMSLPPWPRVYPGANRLYRLGIHRGVDIYRWSAPEGFGIGTEIRALSSGTVTVATVDYEPVSSDEWFDLVTAASTAGTTSEQILERMQGRHVWIDHGDGIRSLYSHMVEMDPAIRPGVTVTAGQRLGGVGVSGTLAESTPGTAVEHLHFEVHIGERYLGQGVTLRETMWWYDQVFGANGG